MGKARGVNENVHMNDKSIISFNHTQLYFNRKAKEFETTIKEKTYDFAGEKVTVREEIKSKRRSIASTFGLDRYGQYYTLVDILLRRSNVLKLLLKSTLVKLIINLYSFFLQHKT